VTPEELRQWVAAGGLFLTAVTHPSYAHEHGVDDNQRLEFLGDAVLQLFVSEMLYHRFPTLREGELTRLRAALVRQASLARRARALGLGEVLRLGSGEPREGLREQDSVLSDTYEAVVGALFLTAGYEATRRFVAREVEEELQELGSEPWRADPKTALQEALQEMGRVPTYRVLRTEGPHHHPRFEVAAYDGEVELGRGQGRSKRLAEEEAARDALRRHPHLSQGRPPASGGPTGSRGSP
jgi:ribonuclease-3